MLLQLALPDELVEPARSQTDLVGLLLLGGWRRIEELVTHGAIRAPSARIGQRRGVVPEDVAHRVTDLVRSRIRGCSASRTVATGLAAVAVHRADDVDVGHGEPAPQLDEQPLRRSLADTGHEAQRSEIGAGDDIAQLCRRGVHRQDGEREPGADAMRAEQRLERVALVAVRGPYSVCPSSRMWW